MSDKVNGLKTAVKHGTMTPKEALADLMKRSKSTNYPPSPKLVNWLQNRK